MMKRCNLEHELYDGLHLGRDVLLNLLTPELNKRLGAGDTGDGGWCGGVGEPGEVSAVDEDGWRRRGGGIWNSGRSLRVRGSALPVRCS